VTTFVDDASGPIDGEIGAGASGARSASSARRRPYVTPALKVFGPFADLTARVGFRSATSDGGFLTWIKTK
jgi:hypothetical protein